MKRFFKAIWRFVPSWGIKRWLLFVIAIIWVVSNLKISPDPEHSPFSLYSITPPSDQEIEVDNSLLQYVTLHNIIDSWQALISQLKGEGGEATITRAQRFGLALPFLIIFVVFMSLRKDGNIFRRLYKQASQISPIDKKEE